MNHAARWRACLTVSRKLIKKYPSDVLATGVTGSVARGTDKKFSDVDFQVLVKENSRLNFHRFILNDSLFSVSARTRSSWLKELTEPNFLLPVVVGSLRSLHTFHDPGHHFVRLRCQSEKLPLSCWKNAVRQGLEEIAEDFGRAKNGYLLHNWPIFEYYSRIVVLETALVDFSLNQKAVLTETDLLDVDTYVKASQLAKLRSLDLTFKKLYKAAKKQNSAPASLNSISEYVPP
ncbi:MAG: nucleotidyltransferase domain-containing protein [Thaumarchaeota archaeon]|nr:nucleotidyltransferase domain-containing protein [Nitrososphaerota archaeon]